MYFVKEVATWSVIVVYNTIYTIISGSYLDSEGVEGKRGAVMSLSGWALPAFAAAIVGLGLFGAYSHFNYSYLDTNTRSASRPVMPVLSSDDEGPSPAQEPSEASTPTSLPAHAGLSSSEGTITSTDPLASEAIETALRESVAVESDKLDGAVEGDGLLRGVFG